MFTTSLALLCAASVFGLGLAGLHLAEVPAVRRLWAVGLLHGLMGVAGLAVLLPVLAGPTRGAASGATQFGGVAAGLLALGLLPAGLLLRARLRRRPMPALAMGLHATAAIGGLVVLAAWASLPG